MLVVNVAVAKPRGDTRTTVQEVSEGCVIKAIFLEYWLNGQGVANTTQFDLIAYKMPGVGTNPTVTDMLNLQSWDNKKNILYTTHGVLAEKGSQSVPVIRQWIAIPKGKQRFGLNDKFQVAMAATGETIQLCGIAIYKEYV